MAVCARQAEVVQVDENCVEGCSSLANRFRNSLPDPGAFDPDEVVGPTSMEDSNDAFEAHMSTSKDKSTGTRAKRFKEERDGRLCLPCELCGELLTEDDQSAHYIASHMGHICACGKCGQILVKGRQLQEHAERCGEPQDAETDSLGDDSLSEERQVVEEGLLEADGTFEGELGAPCHDDTDENCLAYRCPHCGLHLGSERQALEHVARCPEQELLRSGLLEDGERDHRCKHSCGICGKGFFQRCHLREHYTVHTKEKQFACQTCGKQFLRERQLRLHNDMHKGMARYVCPVCDQGTFLKHDHVRHMISHLLAGETICQVCFQIFPGSEHLEQHMDVHLYICGVCGEKFRLRKDMRSHYNSKHTKRL
ncbi:zinc finger and BTB domain-containing protein 1-like [Brienomyrus brachyistius]|uniref:zinc finger and BTB domain-containing protein 1-like n=1 Tax=Brienomyrus brachyistius TaxID=42636 RepID=UPI0020B2A68F|nr:zinc finger and BTB domain-containing protein 1-like [Brienomyrus brachyistius]